MYVLVMVGVVVLAGLAALVVLLPRVDAAPTARGLVLRNRGVPLRRAMVIVATDEGERSRDPARYGVGRLGWTPREIAWSSLGLSGPDRVTGVEVRGRRLGMQVSLHVCVRLPARPTAMG